MRGGDKRGTERQWMHPTTLPVDAGRRLETPPVARTGPVVTGRPGVLTFLGAAGTVTGSKFLVEGARSTVLIDAGLFQGVRELRRRNWAPFPIAPADIAAVVLTHAHLDHCGYLPALVDQGFTGAVVTTPRTAELATIVLRDSAHIQEEDARYAAERGFSKHARPRPLYDTDDVAHVLPLFRRATFGERVSAADGVEVVLQPAGHILGSASALVEVDGHRIVSSGDLGRPRHPLLAPPPPPPACETILVESTYGARRHGADPVDELADIVSRTIERGGVVLIPAFAVDRTEVVLIALKQLVDAGRIPRVPIYLDSPMALATLEVYRSAMRAADPDVRPDVSASALDFGQLHEARSAEESMSLNRPDHPCIIVSASGMATGGRVVHHLRSLLPDPDNAVVLVGYQAVGTRGRDLAEGTDQLKMHGRYVPVRAEIVQVDGFSVHADADELVGWLAGIPEPPQVVYVVHGEADSSRDLATRIRHDLGWLTVVPRDGERVALS
jgi:metallo-beta-lactamase family protein